MKLKPVYLLIIAVLAVGAAVAFALNIDRGEAPPEKQGPTSFEECAAAGNPIMESYPRQCRSKEGRSFVELVDVPVDPPPPPPSSPPGPPSGKEPATGECAVAGCSGTICTGAKEAADIVTTCEYRAEYACFRMTTCERQATGKCGWTETAAFKACLSSPPAME